LYSFSPIIEFIKKTLFENKIRGNVIFALFLNFFKFFLIMTALYLKMRIATLEFEIAMIDARMLQQNSDGLKSNKVELENRVFVIQLYHSQVVIDIF